MINPDDYDEQHVSSAPYQNVRYLEPQDNDQSSEHIMESTMSTVSLEANEGDEQDHNVPSVPYVNECAQLIHKTI